MAKWARSIAFRAAVPPLIVLLPLALAILFVDSQGAVRGTKNLVPDLITYTLLPACVLFTALLIEGLAKAWINRRRGEESADEE